MKKNQIKAGAILSYISLFLNNVIGLVYTPFMLRMMGKSEYGLYSLVASIVGYLTVLDLGFGNTLIVYTSKLKAQGKEKETYRLNGMFLILYSIVGVVCFLIGLFLYFSTDKIFANTMSVEELEKAKVIMLILIFNLAITFPFSIFSSIITAHEKFTFTKIINIIRALLMPCVMVPLLFMGYKSIAMVVVQTILNIMCLLTNMIYCFIKLKVKISFRGFDFKIIKDIFSHSFYVFLGIIVDKIYWNTDQIIIGANSSTEEVAVYNIGSQLNNYFITFTGVISSLMLPKVTQIINSAKNDKEINDIYFKVSRLQFFIGSLILTGFIIFGRKFIEIWAGTGYDNSFIIAILLMGSIYLNLIQNVRVQILYAKERHKFKSILYLIMAIVNVIVSIPMTKLYGGIGAAISTAIITLLGNTIIIGIYYAKVIKLDIIGFMKQIELISCVYIILVVVFSGVIGYLQLNSIIYYILLGIIYFIIFFVLTYFISMNEYERGIINSIFNKLIRRKSL